MFKLTTSTFIIVALFLNSCPGIYAQCQTSSAITPVTINDETTDLPNSRQFINGTNTVVDTSTPGKVSVDASLPNSGVTAGSYTNANISVNAQGLVTSATNGTSGGGGSSSSLTAGNLPATVHNVIVPANGLIQPAPLDHTLTPGSSGTEYTVPTSSSNALDVCAGPDGNVWFTEFNQNKIGKVTPTGTFTEYTIPTSGSAPWGICAGPDANLWFTEQTGNNIGKITTSGTITEYSVTTSSSQPTGLCAGPDGNLWFTEENSNKIGKITTAGSITEYSVTTSSSQPRTICAGPDGNLWFVETAANKIASITPAGTITEYTVTTSSSAPYNICAGADGNLWFTESSGNNIGKISTSGTITEYSVPTSSCTPYGICAGTDSNIWICEYSTGKIASINTAGAIKEYSLPSGGAGASYICIGSDGNLWLAEQGTSKIATWPFTVSGTTPLLGSISAGPNISLSRTTTGISIANTASGAGVNTTVSPVKRVFYSFPTGIGVNTRTYTGTLFSTSISGSTGNGTVASGVLTNAITTSATSGQISYEQPTNSVTTYGLQPKMQVTIVPQTTTNVRYWTCAFNPGGISGGDTPTLTGGGFGFRYSTSAGDSTWKFGTTLGSGVWTFTNTGIPMTAGTAITFAVDATNASQISAYINGSLVATNTTNLPSSSASTNMLPFVIVTLTGSAATVDYASFIGESY